MSVQLTPTLTVRLSIQATVSETFKAVRLQTTSLNRVGVPWHFCYPGTGCVSGVFVRVEFFWLKFELFFFSFFKKMF